MNPANYLSDFTIRIILKPGDLGQVIGRHGILYSREYGYGLAFECYVAEGISEFYHSYDPERDRVWICEKGSEMIGFLLLQHRGLRSAQLRYFYLEPEYRGLGLGKKLLGLYREFLEARAYSSSYLWTTSELEAAASLYRSFGFRLVEEKPSSRFGKPLTEQYYELILEG